MLFFLWFFSPLSQYMCEYRQALISHSGDWQVNTYSCSPSSFAILYKISRFESCFQSKLSILFECGPSPWEWLLRTHENVVAWKPLSSPGDASVSLCYLVPKPPTERLPGGSFTKLGCTSEGSYVFKLETTDTICPTTHIIVTLLSSVGNFIFGQSSMKWLCICAFLRVLSHS